MGLTSKTPWVARLHKSRMSVAYEFKGGKSDAITIGRSLRFRGKTEWKEFVAFQLIPGS